MVKFERYPHINELIKHYVAKLRRDDVANILAEGIDSREKAEVFSRFVWQMIEAINEDEENAIKVMGSTDNTEMLPDLSYEITKLMKENGYYEVWEFVSKEEME